MTPIGRPAICAVTARGMHRSEQAPPARRVLVAIGEQEPDRAAGLLGELCHPAEFAFLVVEIAVHAEGAGADGAECGTDAEKLIGFGIARGNNAASGGLV